MTNEDVYKPPIGIREAWRGSSRVPKLKFVFSVIAACLAVPAPLILFLLGAFNGYVVPIAVFLIAGFAAVIFSLLGGISFGKRSVPEEERALSRLSTNISVLAIIPIAIFLIAWFAAVISFIYKALS